MTVSVTPLTSADAPRVHELDAFAFAQDPSLDTPEEVTRGLDWNRTRGARHEATGEDLAGVYTWFPLELTTPGPRGDGAALDPTTTTPLAGLSWVGVHPDARRRGVLRSMITDFHARARDEGFAVAGLTASEKGIYGRFGYGVATLDVRYTVPRGSTFASASAAVREGADDVTVRLSLRADSDDVAARLRDVDATGGAGRSGLLRFPAVYDRVSLRDRPAARVGTEPQRVLIASRGGRDVGYALFSRDPREPEHHDVAVRVRVLHAHDDAALLALLRRLADVDLTSSAALLGRSLDDAPIGWLDGPRGLDLRIGDGLWVRPLDVGRMLAARGYAAACDVVLDVLDPTCPWNERRWRLSAAEDGTAACEPTSDPADLRIGAAGVGPWYLGLHDARGPESTARAPEHGGIEEVRRGALAAFGLATSTPARPLTGRGF